MKKYQYLKGGSSRVLKLLFMIGALLIGNYANANLHTKSAEQHDEVWIILSGHEQIPWYAELARGMDERTFELINESVEHLQRNVFIERIDAYRTGNSQRLDEIAQALVMKHQGHYPNLIVAENNAALWVANRVNELLGAPIKINAVNVSSQAIAGFSKNEMFNFAKGFETITRTMPEVERVYAILPSSRRTEVEDTWSFEYESQFELELLDDAYTNQEIVDTLANVPANSAILYLGRTTDSITSEGLPILLVKEITELNTAPLFSVQSTLMRAGSVGGYVVHAKDLGRKIIDMAYLIDESLNAAKPHYFFDYQKANKWGLQLENLPETAVLVNSPELLLDAEQLTEIGAGAALVVLSALTLVLLRERQVRIQKERAYEIQQHLTEVSEQRIQQLKTAMDFAKIVLFEENVTQQTGRFIIAPELDEGETPYVGSARLARTRPEFREAVQESLSKLNEPVEYPLTIDGWDEPKWVRNMVISEYRNENGDLMRLQLSRDITQDLKQQQELVSAYKKTEQLLKRLNDVANAGEIGLFSHDIINDVYECNDTYREIFQLSKDQYPKITMKDTASRFDPAFLEKYHQERMDARKTREATTHSRRLLMPDGSIKNVLLHVRPEFESDTLTAITGSAYDVTEQERLIQEKSDALARMEQFAERQRQLFGVIGHELRTPAASLKMMLDAQKSEAKGPYSQEIRNTTDHLMSVLDDLRAVVEPDLLTHRVFSNGVPLQVVEGGITTLRQRIDVDGIKLSITSDEASGKWYKFDLRGLRQVVTNLVKNALIHANPSQLEIDLSVNDGRLMVAVSDDGKGIAEDQFEELLQPFVRGDTTADGTGLGLHICREILRGSDGDLTLGTSRLGGATFIAEIELSNATDTSGAVENEQPDRTLEGKRVLVAEDNLMLRTLTKKLLEEMGATASLHDNGEMAFKAFEAGEFDLVITDIFMPVMNGYQLCENIRSLGSDIPILGVSAATVGTEVDQLIDAGANIALPKPITKEAILKAWAVLA